MTKKMTWDKLLCSDRLGRTNGGSSDSPLRSDFHKDYDRIAFSPTFRRLGNKTQVHPLAKNDHIHSRLTHSLEVSIVGRSLGMAVGEKIKSHLPEHLAPVHIGQIMQAACLAHDLGNPPFGHAGEDAIQSWFSDPQNAHHLEGLTDSQKQDLCSFEGNAQGFRLISQVEHNPGNGGMQLTCATLAAMLKYPWTNTYKTAKGKFGAFQAEESNLLKVAEHTGMITGSDGRYRRHPLAFLAEAADDICYRIIDLEDAVEMGLLRFDDIVPILRPLCSNQDAFDEMADSNQVSRRNKLSYMRSKAIGRAIDAVTTAFAANEEALLDGTFEGELIDACPEVIRTPLNHAKSFAHERIFKATRKLEIELGCYTTLGILLEAFCSAARERCNTDGALSYKAQRVLDLMGFDAPRCGDKLYESLLKVTDHISGMTDHYASHMARQLSGMGH